MQNTKLPQILYVEDDRDLALLVKERLAQAGIIADLAYDGEAALSKLGKEVYDLLAVDQTLPGLDGLGVLLAIAALGPLPPTVMVTGTGNERIAVQTMKLGADDYIIKDLDGGWLDLLPGVIERVLDHRRMAEEKKIAEAALREKEQQLFRAQKFESLGILAGGIAHDFNNILAGIMGYADLAKARLPEWEPAREDLDVIKKAVQRAAELTRQMLAYSGKGKFVVEAVNLSRMVEDTQKMLEVTLSKKAVVKYNLSSDLPSIQADASQIHQVLLNLVINASEALGDDSGAIAIAIDAIQLKNADCAAIHGGSELREGLYVRLEVKDTGCGMDRETLGKIFDPFFTTKFTGRGLGLAAVHGIVRGHKGAIQVTSELGKGTTFHEYFPANGHPVSAAQDESAAISWRGSGTVLIVDDDETIRISAQRMLERAGFSSLTASGGREAIRLFRQHQNEVRCVLLDLTMPDLDGAETFRELRHICSDVRAILSSGYNEEGATERFSGMGLAGFIQKPYDLGTLIARLRGALADGNEGSEQSVTHPTTGVAPLPEDGKSKTGQPLLGSVLVVDDDELRRQSTQVVFEQAGFSTLTAQDGEEAICVYREHRDQVVCVFLDLTLPKMDGEETLRELRQLDPDVRVIVTSGYSAEILTERFAGLDVLGFVCKPDSLDDAIAKLREALGRQ